MENAGRRCMNGVTVVKRGEWGERVAAWWLESKGFEIVERNSRPCAFDRRLEIDIVAKDKSTGTLVFVEVKQHARRTEFQRRLRSVDSRKKALLLRACRAWMRREKWYGPHRFDVIEIYGEPGGGKTEIDHIERVRLFVKPSLFVNWYE